MQSPCNEALTVSLQGSSSSRLYEAAAASGDGGRLGGGINLRPG